jgi:hypothetical protein
VDYAALFEALLSQLVDASEEFGGGGLDVTMGGVEVEDAVASVLGELYVEDGALETVESVAAEAGSLDLGRATFVITFGRSQFHSTKVKFITPNISLFYILG